MAINIDRIRAEFPSLSERDNGRERIYLDNPGGTQVSQRVIDRTIQYFHKMNANHGGVFRTSVDSDALLAEAHEAMACLLNARSPGEIIFGQNMTSLTFAISRSVGRRLKAGDEIIVTRMDHDANISPWILLAEDLDLNIRWLDFDTDTFRHDLSQLDDLLSSRTKFVAVNYASNAIGTINDIRTIGERAHAADALVFVDAVQYVPHAPTDVQKLGCDFLVCSAYKFFGPHQGILWGRRELLEELEPYKVRAADNALPHRFETGTLSHEGLAGTLGAVEYFDWIGSEMATEHHDEFQHLPERTRRLHSAMRAIVEYENVLCLQLTDGLKSIDGVTVFGLTSKEDVTERVPTVAFTMDGVSPKELASILAADNIFTWEGHYYAVEVIRRLGLESSGGMLRVGIAHYNTAAEIDILIDALRSVRVTA